MARLTKAQKESIRETVRYSASDNARDTEGLVYDVVGRCWATRPGYEYVGGIEGAFRSTVDSIGQSLQGRECADYGAPRPLTPVEVQEIVAPLLAHGYGN